MSALRLEDFKPLYEVTVSEHAVERYRERTGNEDMTYFDVCDALLVPQVRAAIAAGAVRAIGWNGWTIVADRGIVVTVYRSK